MHYKARCSTDDNLLTNRLPACGQMLPNADSIAACQVHLDQQANCGMVWQLDLGARGNKTLIAAS